MIRLWALTLAVSMSLPALADAACRQALALGLDVSGSVDRREYRLQLDGLAGALTHPEVQEALLAMPEAPVRLAVYEWSSPWHQRLLIGWTAITGPADIAKMAATLTATTRRPADPSTAIAVARSYGAALLADQSGCWKRTLDLSGDGKSNTGPHPRDVPVPATITVNGLVIGADAPSHTDARQSQVGELVAYYKAYVISGPDAFVETALGFDAYEAAMVRKLKRELQGMMVSMR